MLGEQFHVQLVALGERALQVGDISAWRAARLACALLKYSAWSDEGMSHLFTPDARPSLDAVTPAAARHGLLFDYGLFIRVFMSAHGLVGALLVAMA